MTKDIYKLIGVMSGTSLDGIDLAYVSIIPEDWTFRIIYSETISYTRVWHDKLSKSIQLGKNELKALDESYTDLLAETISTFIRKNNIKEIDALCSHGHTILHQPENQLTYQIGNREELAVTTGHKVICDFRVQDVALGGQGAPLVPIGDKLLFGKYRYCLNLGGFANISFDVNKKRIAYDICPVNLVMNHYCNTIGLEYDENGEIASQGIVNYQLFDALNMLSFYSQEPPKSLGLEWVEEYIFPLIDSFKLPTEDILRTFVEHVAFQINKSLKTKGTLFITGGGAYNRFLISRIKTLSDSDIIIPSKEIIEYKEALVFALLGVLRMRNETNCLSSVTGAMHDHSSGNIFTP